MPASAKVMIRAEGLGKRYHIEPLARPPQLRELLTEALRSPLRFLRPGRRETFWALRGVSFEVREGEVLGLIGRNGAGKTTLLKLLARITRPTEGWAEIRGHAGSLLEVGTGFHPDLTGRENTFLSGAILGMRRSEIARKFDEIVAFAEIEQFIDTPVKHYSAGMYVRLAFAVAAHLEPDILLVDEVLAVGDLKFQKKCLGKMDAASRSGRTIVLVSHQLSQIRRLCQRALWIDGGAVRMQGSVHEVASAYEAAMAAPDSPPAQTAQAPPGSSRTARIVRWEIAEPRDGECHSPHTLPALGPAAIRMILDAPVSLPRAEVELRLHNVERLLLWSAHFPGLRLEAGRNELLLRFPLLPLLPGSYTWSATLWDDEGGEERWESVPPMTVTAESAVLPAAEPAPLLNLPCELSLRRPGP